MPTASRRRRAGGRCTCPTPCRARPVEVEPLRAHPDRARPASGSRGPSECTGADRAAICPHFGVCGGCAGPALGRPPQSTGMEGAPREWPQRWRRPDLEAPLDDLIVRPWRGPAAARCSHARLGNARRASRVGICGAARASVGGDRSAARSLLPGPSSCDRGRLGRFAEALNAGSRRGPPAKPASTCRRPQPRPASIIRRRGPQVRPRRGTASGRACPPCRTAWAGADHTPRPKIIAQRAAPTCEHGPRASVVPAARRFPAADHRRGGRRWRARGGRIGGAVRRISPTCSLASARLRCGWPKRAPRVTARPTADKGRDRPR